MAEPFLQSCVSILRSISCGELKDTYVDGEYHSDAWNAFNSLWRSDSDAKKVLTPYQRSILREFWFIIENSDANPDTPTPDEDDWSAVQASATRLLDMLLDETANGQSVPFKSWI